MPKVFAKPEFEFVRIAPETVLPANLYLSSAHTPAEAFRDMTWAINTAPINAAFWMPPGDVLPAALKEGFIRIHTRKPDAFDRCANKITDSLETLFSKAAKEFTPKHRKLVQAWAATYDGIFDDIRTSGLGVYLDVNFVGSYDDRSTPNAEIKPHYDKCRTHKAYSLQDPSGQTRDYSNMAHMYNVLNGQGTVFFDNDDFSKDGSNVFFKPRINAYQTEPGMLALISHAKWGHEPSLHAVPWVQAEEPAITRSAWTVAVSYEQGFDMEDHQRWYDAHMASHRVLEPAL